jgi:hypothetical protein
MCGKILEPLQFGIMHNKIVGNNLQVAADTKVPSVKGVSDEYIYRYPVHIVKQKEHQKMALGYSNIKFLTEIST